MKLRTYYLLSWLSGLLTLIFSVGGALAFVTYLSSPSTVDGIVRKGHMSIMEFILPLCCLFYPVSLCFPVLCFPQDEDTGAHVSAFSVEPCFISGYCGGYASINDTSAQLGN